MDFTADVGIALVVGIGLGFILCRATKWFTTSDRDTGPHKTGGTNPPPPE